MNDASSNPVGTDQNSKMQTSTVPPLIGHPRSNLQGAFYLEVNEKANRYSNTRKKAGLNLRVPILNQTEYFLHRHREGGAAQSMGEALLEQSAHKFIANKPVPATSHRTSTE